MLSNPTGAQALGQAAFGAGVGLIHLDDLMCVGTESSLFDCVFDPTHNCAHDEDAGVICMPECKLHSPSFTPVPTSILPSTLFSHAVVCNNGDIRLCDSSGYCGSNLMSGRLEYCIDEAWGSVCNNMWSVSDATVACAQLGYSVSGIVIHTPFTIYSHLGLSLHVCETNKIFTLFSLTGGVPISDSRYGVGNPEDPIQAGGLDCVGTETSLAQCPSTGTSGCTHASDAGLECQPSKCMCIY